MKVILCLLFSWLPFTALVAQDTLIGPNGGKIKIAGYYRMEVVECYEYLEVFLYELDMQPRGNRGLNGTAEFYFPDGSRLQSQLYPYALNGFTANIKQQCFASCEITVHGVGFSVKAVFTGFGENNDDCKRPTRNQKPK